MTLKELFRSVKFDSILPIILAYDPDIKGCEASLKQAFDSIRIIETSDNIPNEIIRVEYFNSIDSSEGYRVSNCSNASYKVSAERTVQTALNLNLTSEELAAYCLWELTYWGFSDGEIIEEFRVDALGRWGTPSNRFEEEYALKSKRWFPPVSLSDSINSFCSSKNRSKKKRDYRREKRLKQLYRYAKIEELCRYINSNEIIGITNEDLWDLKNVDGFTVTTDRSYAETDYLAEEYMCELYEKYHNCHSDIIHSIAVITGGCAVKNELNELKQTLEKTLPNVKIGIGNRSQPQISIIIIEVISSHKV